MKLGVEFGAVPMGLDQVAARADCELCDGTGCPCIRMRDWQSIEQGCDCGCSQCGRRPERREQR